MKTKIVIEVETTNMKEFVPEEYLGGGICPADKLVTDEVEQDLHENIKIAFTSFFSAKAAYKEQRERVMDVIEEIVFEQDTIPEGVESFSGICDVKISVLK